MPRHHGRPPTAIHLAFCVLRRLAWFGAVRYNIGGMEFSCNDIEHGVLRGNAPSPASLGVLLGRPRWASNTFKKKDPRARLVRDSHARRTDTHAGSRLRHLMHDHCDTHFPERWLHSQSVLRMLHMTSVQQSAAYS